MMKSKKFICLSAISLLSVGLVMGVAFDKGAMRAASAEEAFGYDYIAYNSMNFSVEQTFGNASIDHIDSSGRTNATYWGADHTYGALDDFLNTFEHENMGGAWKGVIRTNLPWRQSRENTFVTFTLGGHDKNYVRIFNIADPTKEIICHSRLRQWVMELRCVDVSSILNEEGDTYLKLEIFDDTLENIDGYESVPYPGVTFGALQVNRSLTDAAKSLSVHKNTLAIDTRYEEGVVRDILNDYENNEEYTAIKDVTILEANTGFEDDNDGAMVNWAYDYNYSHDGKEGDYDHRSGIGFGYSISDQSTMPWVEAMPYNKTGNRFFWGTGIDGAFESFKLRFLSNRFTVSGNYISVKMAGASAAVALLDANNITGEPLMEVKNETVNFYDPAGGVANIIESGARVNTMTRTYIDVADFKGREVVLAIEDYKTGGGWGLVFFDEIVTNITNIEGFGYDAITQSYGDNVFNGVIKDSYVSRHENDETLAAYNFLKDTYYPVVRNYGGESSSLCNIASEYSNILTAYHQLSEDARRIVAASKDYSYGVKTGGTTGAGYSRGFLETEIVVGSTLAYMAEVTGNTPDPILSHYASTYVMTDSILNQDVSIYVIVGALIALVAFTTLVVLKKRKYNK